MKFKTFFRFILLILWSLLMVGVGWITKSPFDKKLVQPPLGEVYCKDVPYSPPKEIIDITSLGDQGSDYPKRLEIYSHGFLLDVFVIDNPVRSVIDDKCNFPSLFAVNEYHGSDSLKWEYFLFPKETPKFLVIRSIYDSETAYLEAFGIYKFGKLSLDRVFKLGFGDRQAKILKAEFSVTDNSFVVKRTHTNWETGDKLNTIEKYVWDSESNSFVLKV